MVDSRAITVIDAEGAVVGREGLTEHLQCLGLLALIGIDTAYVVQTHRLTGEVGTTPAIKITTYIVYCNISLSLFKHFSL